MARHNIVNIYGSILDDPVISKDEQGNFKKGMAYITLIRGFRDAGYEENSLRYDCPMLFSGNPDVVEQMSGIHKNDIVEVKGVFTVMNSAKATRCSTCSHKNRIMGEMSFITPLFFDIRKTGLTEAESLNDLKAHMEISNQVLLIGDLCRDVTFYGNDKMFQASYPLAVNRKYYLNDGRLNDRTDYIHIVSFGENAKNDASALHHRIRRAGRRPSAGPSVLKKPYLRKLRDGISVAGLYCGSNPLLNGISLQLQYT